MTLSRSIQTMWPKDELFISPTESTAQGSIALGMVCQLLPENHLGPRKFRRLDDDPHPARLDRPFALVLLESAHHTSYDSG